MANFCGKCGSPVNQENGLCPKCDEIKIKEVEESKKNSGISETQQEECAIQDKAVDEASSNETESSVDDTSVVNENIAEDVVEATDETVHIDSKVVDSQNTPEVPDDEQRTENMQEIKANDDSQVKTEETPAEKNTVCETGANQNTQQNTQQNTYNQNYNPQQQYVNTQYQQPYNYTVNYQESPKKKKVPVFRTILSVLLTILFFISFTATSVLFTVRFLFSGNSIENILSAAIENDSFLDMDLEEMYREIRKEHSIKIDDERLLDFISKSSLTEFMSDKISDGLKIIADGNGDIKLTKEEVLDLIDENKKTVESVFETDYDTVDFDKVIDVVFDDKEEIVVLSSDDVDGISSDILSVVVETISIQVLIALIIITVVIVVLMGLNNLSQGACGVGVILVINGSVSSLIALGLNIMISVLPNAAEGLFGELTQLMTSILSGFVLTFTIASLATLLSGIIILVVRKIVRKSINKKAVKQ